MPQLRIGIDHFLAASLVAKYTDFITSRHQAFAIASKMQ